MTAPQTPALTPRQSDPSKPRRGRWWRVLLGMALLVLVAAGGWALFLRPKAGEPAGPKATAPPKTSATTAPMPTPTSDPQSGEDVESAFRAIYSKRTRAIVERQPEVVDEIYLPDCNCYELKSIVQEGIRRTEHHIGYHPTVLLVKRQETGVGGGNIASVQVVTEQGPYTITDDQGKVIGREPGWAPQSTSWDLFRSGPGSPWKVGFLLVEGSPDKVLGPGWRDTAK